MERQVFTYLFPEDRNNWIGVLLSRAGGRSCTAPGMDKDSLWCWGVGERLRMGRGEVVGKEQNVF